MLCSLHQNVKEIDRGVWPEFHFMQPFFKRKRIWLYFVCFVVQIKMSIAIKKRNIKVRVIANLYFLVLFCKKEKKKRKELSMKFSN